MCALSTAAECAHSAAYCTPKPKSVQLNVQLNAQSNVELNAKIRLHILHQNQWTTANVHLTMGWLQLVGSLKL